MSDTPKAKPILFSGPMVRAILDGKKTQTRRVVQPIKLHEEYGKPIWDQAWLDDSYGRIPCLKVQFDHHGDTEGQTTHRHWAEYDPGDMLYVRETWRAGIEWDDTKPSEIDPLCGGNQIRYECDGEMWEHTPHGSSRVGQCKLDDGWGKARPSIHMPRWASRITLEVTGVRVERVQKISRGDIKAEGITIPDGPSCDAYDDARLDFSRLWDSINAKRGFGWDANPWVWVYEFKVAEVRR